MIHLRFPDLGQLCFIPTVHSEKPVCSTVKSPFLAPRSSEGNACPLGLETLGCTLPPVIFQESYMVGSDRQSTGHSWEERLVSNSDFSLGSLKDPGVKKGTPEMPQPLTFSVINRKKLMHPYTHHLPGAETATMQRAGTKELGGIDPKRT